MREIIGTTCLVFCLSLLPLSPVHAHANTETICGHIFGPSSLESEDDLLQLDKSFADLFAVMGGAASSRNSSRIYRVQEPERSH